MSTLNGHERDRFDLIARATLANPFSPERDELDLKIIGEAVDSGKSLALLLARVSALVDGLDARRLNRLSSFDAVDRPLVGKVFLFDVFHRFLEQIDNLIEAQVRSPHRSIEVAFASETIGLLAARGFQDRDAVRYFSFFYQLRRAYYFIQKRIIGAGPSMRRLRMSLWNNIFTRNLQLYEEQLWNRMEDFSTVLLGETGTGKGAAAAAIGRSGFIPFDERKGRFSENFLETFLSINLSQYPDTLIESELFGHRKGAFTGAIETHQGVFSRCSPHGSIFLDEIGEVGVPIQIKLLKVLQEREFTPLGSHEHLSFQGRIIAATNRPLDELREQGRFRDDFFYRICSDIIVFPPLRERLREEPHELHALVRDIAARLLGGTSEELVADVLTQIRISPGKDYPWPGNVRELEQCVRRILLTGGYSGERPKASRNAIAELASLMETGSIGADELLERYAAHLLATRGTYEEVSAILGVDRRTAKKYASARRITPRTP